MNWKQVVTVTLWSVILFSMLGCIGQQYSNPQDTLTLPPQTVTQTTTMPGTVIEVIIPAETITVTPAQITSPVTITADPITITQTVPAETVVQTVTIPPQTVEVPVTSTQSVEITITTQQIIQKTITLEGEPFVITTTKPVTITTTKLICPSGYVVHPSYPEYGCIPLEDAKMLSIGSGGLEGFSGIQLLVMVGILGLVIIGLRRRSKK